LEEKAEFPEAIFGVPQSQEDSNAQLRQITKLLRSGADPNETESKKSKNGPSMLQVAILKGDLRLVEILLEHGANPYHRSMDGMHPLAMAINMESDERLAIISLLVQQMSGKFMSITIPAGKNMKNIDIPETSLSPIQCALLNGDLAVFELFASLRARRVRRAPDDLQYLINWGAREGRVEVIKALNDWMPRLPSKQRRTYRSFTHALYCAIKAGNVNATRELLNFSDININDAYYRGFTALHWAVYFYNRSAETNDIEVVRALLNDSRIYFDVNAYTLTYRPVKPIHIAAHRDYSGNCLRELLSDPDIQVNALDPVFNDTALCRAVKKNNINAIKVLLEDSRTNLDVHPDIVMTSTPEACSLLEEARKRKLGL